MRPHEGMPPCEHAAFVADIDYARQMTLTRVITEVRDDAGEPRQHAAIAPLQGSRKGCGRWCRIRSGRYRCCGMTGAGMGTGFVTATGVAIASVSAGAKAQLCCDSVVILVLAARPPLAVDRITPFLTHLVRALLAPDLIARWETGHRLHRPEAPPCPH